MCPIWLAILLLEYHMGDFNRIKPAKQWENAIANEASSSLFWSLPFLPEIFYRSYDLNSNFTKKPNPNTLNVLSRLSQKQGFPIINIHQVLVQRAATEDSCNIKNKSILEGSLKHISKYVLTKTSSSHMAETFYCHFSAISHFCV